MHPAATFSSEHHSLTQVEMAGEEHVTACSQGTNEHGSQLLGVDYLSKQEKEALQAARLAHQKLWTSVNKWKRGPLSRYGWPELCLPK